MSARSDVAPSIPAALANLPTLGGLIVPWVTPRTTDGRYLLGAVDATRTQAALRRRLCGVCGHPLGDRLVLLMRESDLPRRATPEPALHPHCADMRILCLIRYAQAHPRIALQGA